MMRKLYGHVRPWLAAVAVVLALALALPPVGSDARQYAFVQALQFVTFAVAAPALLVLGWPRRRPSAAARPGTPSGPGSGSGAPPGAPGTGELAELTADQAMAGQAAADQHLTPVAAARLLPFLALVVTWRLPVVLSALTSHPALVAVEAVTLAAAGASLWTELVRPPASRPGLPTALRAAMAAVAMWTIWAIAYITGMSSIGLVTFHGSASADILGPAADRQLATAVMWAVPAICLVPVVFVMALAWVSDRELADRRSRGPRPAGRIAPLGGPPRPPRGWRSSRG